MKRALFSLVTLGALCTSSIAVADGDKDFTFDDPGKLVNGSGKGRADTNVYVKDMRFPIETGPAFANSQVWGRGGGDQPGSQCDKENFSYPWHDNYCETRDWDMPLCPSGNGHQGQDIRAATCQKGVHWVVSAQDGTVTNIGSYSVYITAADGTRFDYLHMSDVAVKNGEKVKRGQHIGKVSNQFGGSATTVHLHFNIRQNVAGVGSVYVPPYLSLVNAYKELLNPKVDTPPPPAPEVPAPKEEKAAPLPPPEEPPPPAVEDGCTAAGGSASMATPILLAAAIAVVLRRRRA